MVRNVLRLEAFGKALTFLQTFACFRFLDMAAAFPSLSRKLCFRSLARMGAAPWWIEAVKELYRDNYHYILWKGVRYRGFTFVQGSKAG